MRVFAASIAGSVAGKTRADERSQRPYKARVTVWDGARESVSTCSWKSRVDGVTARASGNKILERVLAEEFDEVRGDLPPQIEGGTVSDAAAPARLAHGVPFEEGVNGYLQRTEWNVRDTDGTVVFTLAATVTGGSAKTIQFAKKHEKPVIHISRDADGGEAASELQTFVARNGIKTLNVAGSRESKEPGIHDWVVDVIEAAFFSAGDSDQGGGD